MRRILAASAAAAAMLAPAGLTIANATSASAAATSPAAAGPIHLGLGGMCLDNRGNAATPGNPVQIWKCISGDASQQWQFYPDGSIRPASHSVYELSLSAGDTSPNGRPYADLVVANAAAPVTWSPTAGRALVTSLSTSALSGSFSLNDPGFSTSNGTRLIGSPGIGSAPNEQFTPPGSHYAVSKLTYRPDSGGGGDNWALDTITRTSSVVWEGNDSSAHVYAGAVSDTGTFVTVPGNLTPNQGLHPGTKLGDSTIGTMSGLTAYSFTTSQFVGNHAPPAAAQGVEPIGTSLWYQLFFPASATATSTTYPGELNSGPLDWSWSYNIASDNCVKAESWVDAQSNSSGQATVAGDITAPASSSC